MYLGHVVGGGTGTPDSTTIGNGLERIMREITAGKSLDQAIADNSGGRFAGLTDFQNQLRAPNSEIRDFVRGLILETSTGSGSILGSSLDSTMTAIIALASNTEGFLSINANNSIVSNTYPPGFTVIAGGGATISGNPIGTGAPPPLGNPIRPGAQVPPTEITMGGGGSFSTFILQVGANERDTLAVHIGSISTVSLGLTGASIASQDSARESMTTVTEAINSVSLSRASLGAYQNRLEFKIHNLDNSAENLSASESRIRDADMAKMMTEFTRNNILLQSSMTVLAQANALPQGVLQLVG
jgi:flagellin-like hook-associated protein FlgL